MTKKTYHEGAEAERKAFKAYLKRQNAKASGNVEVETLMTIRLWVDKRCDRYRKVKGGL